MTPDEARAERLREWNRLGMEWGDWDQWRRAIGRAYSSLRVLLDRAFFCRAVVDPLWLEREWERIAGYEAALSSERQRLERATNDMTKELNE